MGPTKHMISSQMVGLDWTNPCINDIEPSVNPILDHNEGQWIWGTKGGAIMRCNES